MSDINVTVQDEIVNIDVLDTPVLVNVVNSPGQQGPAGPGVPVGGTAGQILAKASATNYDTEWINNYAKYLATNVRNQTGSTIGAFQVVYISGATGNKPLISLADADTEASSSKTYGVTATSIANNGTGDVVTAGELSGINTSAFNEGDLLWLSTTAGGVVTSPPAEPAHAVFIGYVVRSHPTLGVIDVAIANGYELNELHGVQITSAANNDGLFYNSTSTLWENKSIATALGYTPANAATTLTINGVTYDLSTSRTWTIAAGISGSGASGQVTYWTGASAVSGSNNLFWDNANSRLGIGTNAPLSRLHLKPAVAATSGIILEHPQATPTNGTETIVYITGNGQTTAGANNSEVGFFVAGPGSASFADGPFFIMRGNNFTRAANQRGFVAFASGQVSSPLGNDGVLGFWCPSSYIDFATTQFVTSRMRLFNNGNLGLNFLTDPGVKLGVSGDTLLRGSGATSATTALTVQNSSSTNLFVVRNDGNVGIGTNAPNSPLTVIGNAFFGGASPSIFMNGSATNQTALISNANGNIASLILRCAQIKFEDGNSVQKLLLSTTGNLILQNGGTFTDGGQRLQVYGDTLLRGSGATSATTALTVQDSAGVDMLIMRNDGLLRIVKRYINTSQDLNVGFGASNDGSAYNAAGLGQLFSTANRTSAGVNYAFFGGNITNTSGAFYHLRTTGIPNFAPTSGTGTFFILSLEATINQIGGANGITRGLYVNPTLTAAADFRAIETTTGKIVFGNLPTSSAGLPTGALWNDAGTVKIV